MIRVGVIGLGKIGLLHMGLLNVLEGSRVVAFAEPQTAVRKFAKRFVPQFNGYEDYQDMLDKESLDAVAICTPTFLHSVIANACIEKDLPFLVEKPLAVSAADCRALVDKNRSAGVINLVGYACMRYTPTFQKAKDLLDQGLIGDPTSALGSMRSNQTLDRRQGWQYDPKRSGGGALINFGSHLIYLMQWFFGSASLVNARTDSVYSERVEDTCEGQITYDGGLTAEFAVSWSDREYTAPESTLEVRGESGTIVATSRYVDVELKERKLDFKAGKTRLSVQDFWPTVEYELGGPEFSLEDRHFIDSVIAQKKTYVDLQVARQVQEVIETAYASAKDRQSHEVDVD